MSTDATKNLSVFKYALKGGALLGLICIVFFLTVFYSHQMSNTFISWFLYLFIFFFLFFGLRYIRAKPFNGQISFQKAFLFCFLSVIFAAVTTVAFEAVFFARLSQEAINQLLSELQDRYVNKGFTPAQVEAAMRIMRLTYSNIWVMSGIGLFNFGLIGGAFSIVLAAIWKKEKPEVFVE